MFPYFGSKRTLAKYYPRPVYNRIIEPFAGSAAYSLKHFEHEVTLIEKYDVIVNIWKWLQEASTADVLGLPRLEPGDDLRKIMEPGPARDFMAYLTQIQSAHRTYVMAGGTAKRELAGRIKSAAGNLYKIRHWKIRQGDYTNLPNVPATWFIDPPYQYGGDNYILGNKELDYAALAAWARSRFGQVIVCENTRADWMEFSPMRGIRTIAGTEDTTEAIWSNLPTDYDLRQSDFFSTFTSIDT